MNTKFQFREGNNTDAETIVKFQLAMALETEDLALDKEICTKGVLEVFKNSTRGKYHVVEHNKKVIASLLIVPEWSDWRNGEVWWIHSVYVLPEFRKEKVFTQFYDYIKAKVQASTQVRGLRLYVDKRNTIAQKVYQKIGMNNQHYELYEWMKTF
jgi:GNAT superfamily N-acetyltransferase